jgi:hypothetical protein
METKASRDVYTFNLTAAGQLRIDPGASSGYITWTLTNATTGATVATNYLAQTVSGLSSGAYKVTVQPRLEHTGAYSLALLQPGG